MIIEAKIELVSASPYQPSRKHDEPKRDKEGADDYEARTWRSKGHYLPTGEMFIPPMAFKQCFDTAARRLAIPIPGKGKSTYTKHFVSGLLITDPLPIAAKRDDVEGEWFFCNSDGVRGSGKRVRRCFPVVRSWKGALTVHVFDATIKRDIFQQVITSAGQFVGVGRFRPENAGFYGRFSAEVVAWKETK